MTDLRPCFVYRLCGGNQRALFHRWTDIDGKAFGLVEFEDGIVLMVPYSSITFVGTAEEMNKIAYEPYWKGEQDGD